MWTAGPSLLHRWEWVRWGSREIGSHFSHHSQPHTPLLPGSINCIWHLGGVCHQQWGLSLPLSNDYAIYEECAVIAHPPFHIVLHSLSFSNSDKREDDNRDSQLRPSTWAWNLCNFLYKTFFFLTSTFQDHVILKGGREVLLLIAV